jgi:two-component system, chemotaxis family, CheB/CheR fusion protein
LRKLLEEIIPQNTSFENFCLEGSFPRVGRKVLLLNARRFEAVPAKGLVLLAFRDVTDDNRTGR